MILSLSENANVNYVCTVFQFKEYMRHPHGNADKLEIVTYQGCPVIVQKGLYRDGDWLVLFPTETHISKSFLSEHNAFRHTELNKDPQHAAGFFEDNCRVKAISLRGVTSRGYIVPASYLNLTSDDLVDGLNFDTVNGKLLVKKYIVPVQVLRGETKGTYRSRKKSELVRIVEGQFEFHYDTEMLAKNLDLLNPDDVISLTHKWHGTSLISAKLLCYRKLSIFEKLKRLFGGKVILTEYRLITSSRKRILTLQDKNENKRIYDSGSASDRLYLCAGKILEPYIEDGMTVYSEIAGYMPSGKEIQKGYDYKCESGTFKIMPYRVTKLDTGGRDGANGKWSEFALQQVNEYAEAAGKAQAEAAGKAQATGKAQAEAAGKAQAEAAGKAQVEAAGKAQAEAAGKAQAAAADKAGAGCRQSAGAGNGSRQKCGRLDNSHNNRLQRYGKRYIPRFADIGYRAVAQRISHTSVKR